MQHTHHIGARTERSRAYAWSPSYSFTPHPFDVPICLYDVLNTPQPYGPELNQRRAQMLGKSTREPGTTAWDFNLVPEFKLDEVVFAPDLLSGAHTLLEERAKEMVLIPGNPSHQWLFYALNMHHQQHLLSPILNSEKDSEYWTQAALQRGLLVQQTLQTKTTPTFLTRRTIPWLCSGGSIMNVVADALGGDQDLWPRWYYDKMPDPFSVVVEVKSTAILHGDPLSNIMDPLLHHHSTASPGHATAIPFTWPGMDQTISGKPNDLITQLWEEMVTADVAYGLLSSYDWSVFAYRERKNSKHTLYLSRPYSTIGQDNLVFASAAWWHLALNRGEQPTLPQVERPFTSDPDVPGLLREALEAPATFWV